MSEFEFEGGSRGGPSAEEHWRHSHMAGRGARSPFVPPTGSQPDWTAARSEGRAERAQAHAEEAKLKIDNLQKTMDGHFAAIEERLVALEEGDHPCQVASGILEQRAAERVSAAGSEGLRPGMTVWEKLTRRGPYVLLQPYEGQAGRGVEFPVLDPRENAPNCFRMVVVPDAWIVQDKKGARHMIPLANLTTERPPLGLLSPGRWGPQVVDLLREHAQTIVLWSIVAICLAAYHAYMLGLQRAAQ